MKTSLGGKHDLRPTRPPVDFSDSDFTLSHKKSDFRDSGLEKTITGSRQLDINIETLTMDVQDVLELGIVLDFKLEGIRFFDGKGTHHAELLLRPQYVIDGH